MNRSDFTFTNTLRVRWNEVDRQNIVFNGNYFVYFDSTITEYWRTIGFNYPQEMVDKLGTDMFAVKASAEYHGSATFDDAIEVCCRVAHIGRSSLQFLFGVFLGAEHITSGELVYVHADPKTKKSVPWPETLKSSILGFEKVKPNLAGASRDPASS
jgi:acyl-CoA thioester hydrolase